MGHSVGRAFEIPRSILKSLEVYTSTRTAHFVLQKVAQTTRMYRIGFYLLIVACRLEAANSYQYLRRGCAKNDI